MGPSAIRLARLTPILQGLGYPVEDHGDLNIPVPETQPIGQVNAKFLPLISAVCREVAVQVEGVLESGGFPLVLGGDHSIAIGTISGISNYARRKNPEAESPRVGVIWFDAHGDINTPESSPSGNVHGMPVSALLGQGPPELTDIAYPGAKVRPESFVQVGLRDIDQREKELIRRSGITPFTMTNIDRRGMASIIEEALEIACRETDLLHVSFDIDALDPRHAPGTGTTKIGGLTYREAHLALEIIAESGRLTSFELVEINPTLDTQNRTAEVAVELISSALGKTIL